jgi:hypothetical protein
VKHFRAWLNEWRAYLRFQREYRGALRITDPAERVRELQRLADVAAGWAKKRRVALSPSSDTEAGR